MKIRKRKITLAQKSSLYGYLFIAPWLLGIILFVAMPFIESFKFSFHNVKMLPTGRTMEFIGLQHFQDIWVKDMYFITTLIRFLIDTILKVPVIVVFALIIAILINQKIRFKGLFRTIFFLPVIIVSGPVMIELTKQGATSIPMINQAELLGILTTVLPLWVAEPVGNLFSQVILILWYSGVQILMFLAALQKVNPSLYEAAKIDGGSAWECFWKITLPTIKPMILLNAVYTVVTVANNEQNEVINLIMLNIFNSNRGYGFATAMAWMYAGIIAIILIMIGLIFKERKDPAIKKAEKELKKQNKDLKKLRKQMKEIEKRKEGFHA